MNPFSFLPMKDYKQRHEQLLREAEQYRLVEEALKAEKSKPRNTTHILAVIGKELTYIGFGLEIRFGDQSDTNPALTRKSNPGGCS